MLTGNQSEELQDASVQLPRAMMFATIGNGLLGVRKCDSVLNMTNVLLKVVLNSYAHCLLVRTQH